MRISSGLGTILLLGLLHSSQSVAQDQIVPLDQSLTTKELIDVSAFIRFKEPWLFEFLRDEGLEFSSEILAVGRFDLNEDGREELSVAVIHPSDGRALDQEIRSGRSPFHRPPVPGWGGALTQPRPVGPQGPQVQYVPGLMPWSGPRPWSGAPIGCGDPCGV